MNFFDAQERSYRKTRLLLVLMTLAVIAVVISVTAVIAAALWLTTSPTDAVSFLAWTQFNRELVVWTACGTAAFIGFASLYRVSSLRDGGGSVARELGGTPVSHDEQDPMRRRLRNVIEEIALASGVPVPEIYVLDHEAGINAFAAGFQPEDAAITVTRGTLETLNREELQGVIAHEFSHVLNGDMRLNIRLMGPLFGILAIGLLGRMLLRNSRLSGGRRNKGVAAVMALGVGLSVTGYIGLLLGRIIKAGVSRQREYLADASAVQFTRQTEGIAGALKKIGGLVDGSSINQTEAEEVSHMLFATGLTSLSRVLASHPPLLNRIQALEPTFSETQFKRLSTARINLGGDDHGAQGVSAFVQNPSNTAHYTVPTTSPDEAEQLLDSIGNPTDNHISAARAFIADIPESVQHALASSDRVLLLPPAFLLHPNSATRSTQLNLLVQQLGSRRSQAIEQFYLDLQTLNFEARLPLLDLALPRIKTQPAERIAYLDNLLEQLATCDNRLELFEYALLRIFRGYMQAATSPAVGQGWSNLSDNKMLTSATILLQVFAHQTSLNEAESSQALQRGLAELGGRARAASFPGNWATAADQALRTLRRCTPRGRQRVVRALIATALHDGHINQPESELLRAFCMMLDCPLPPVLNAHSPA